MPADSTASGSLRPGPGGPAGPDGPDGPGARRPIAITPAGVIGTILLALVIAGCVRLGFWQLARHEERRALNEHVAARLDAAPITGAAMLRDTAGLFHRTAHLAGSYDGDRSIVLPGRSYRGVPGVYLLTPLLLDGSDAAVLVNRGWVPSADAATIDVADFPVHGPVAVRGLVLPFPGSAQSLAQRESAAPRDETFRRVWYNLDEAALRAQYPYPLMPAMVQALPEPGAAPAGRSGYPARLDPPALDQGPHLGYALQWFGFALVGLFGWIALVLRDRSPPRVTAPPMIVALALLAAAAPANAQLRPLDAAEWRIFDPGVRLVADVGAALLWDQRASLAGTSGTLLEGGNYALTFRSGRMAVSLAGTALLRLSDEQVYAPPEGAAQPSDGEPRQEPGRAIAATLLRLSPAHWPADVVVRFGAVLPTTSHTSGLDRDRTDFFALAGVRYRAGRLTLSTEQGVGINGTLYNHYPQSDVWVYTVAGTWDLAAPAGTALRGTVELLGHQDGHGEPPRGNEKQRELRAGVDLGRGWLIRLRYVRGLSEYSPSHGIRLGAGYIL
jgi:surfeit locus 1 family protein